MKARIIVVEDEPDLREAVAEYLGASGYDVATAENAVAARALFEAQSFNLAILDIAMPGEDGLSLGRWLRSKTPIGVIYATAAGTALDRIVGLELGADDYIVKPYELREVLARVRSVLRRVPQPAAPQAAKAEAGNRRRVTFGGFQADFDGRLVTGADGAVIEMAKSEFDVLEVFLTRANRLLTRAAISEAIGFVEDPESSRAVDIRIMRLRKKIEADPANPKFLRTVRGEGYIFSLPSGDSN
ncbi:DNA-binding response regulator, OmpR family, contains REC and winged-helix (wHTH) domain [Mesorhizobium sp. NFR06]|uniref:response regulator transcription factor n=1 Tax=Mesorhizobium sp. NFR06 TaxID=1566290 RepID=UPI0008EA33F9|nr:response regulator transcription factor [Mesorhizobium sp. NFR06]SFP27161.1 DNA-binding response regulator, OmpR family, contains REC and winged-helix (wHTH) domain [Mesorhizobium sp. NFR06]